jgi:hypothetical protein
MLKITRKWIRKELYFFTLIHQLFRDLSCHVSFLNNVAIYLIG